MSYVFATRPILDPLFQFREQLSHPVLVFVQPHAAPGHQDRRRTSLHGDRGRDAFHGLPCDGDYRAT